MLLSPALAVASVLAATRVARACEPPDLTGAPDLVASVRDELDRHGAVSTSCAPIHARIERRGEDIIVIRVGGSPQERLVSDSTTAASVIESWSRSDLVDPLLAGHAFVVPPPRVEAAPPFPIIVREAPAREESHGLQAYAAFETAFADDRSNWVGAMFGACVRIGRACATARARVATVIDGAASWGGAHRRATDALVGGDVPFRTGATYMTVGFGAGFGAVHTSPGTTGSGSETLGLRADAHVAWLVPVGGNLLLDLSASVGLAEVTDDETTTVEAAPTEPRIIGRLGLGLRFGEP
ncbi:MAG TPA: hypothetical protein VGM90_33685 [Kofleriaceae bacterium]|jgi:hypothetical protein